MPAGRGRLPFAGKIGCFRPGLGRWRGFAPPAACSSLRVFLCLAGISGIVIFGLSPAGEVVAAEVEHKAPAEGQPSMEMLEFLGEWQTGEGVWFDPTEKEQQQVPPPEQGQEQNHDETR